MRIFNTYRPRMRINDRQVVPNFIFQALHGYADDLRAGERRALSTTSSKEPGLLNSERKWPDQHRQPYEMTIRSSQTLVNEITGNAGESSSSRCRRTDRSSANQTSARRLAGLGADRSVARKGWWRRSLTIAASSG